MVNEYLDIIGLGIFKALNDKRYPILVNGKISESAIPTSITNSITSILSLIPDAASSENKLADKNFVNSSIATNTATFRGTFDDLATLQATSADINDYAFYVHTDEIGNTAYDRYKHNGSTWVFEYTLNNSSFTAEQWSAINSGITTTKVGNYDAHLINYSNPHKVTKSQVGLGLVENVAISTWKGSENITTLGTITKGTWKGTKIGNDYLANSSITIGTTAISLGSTAKSLAGIEKLQLNDAKSNLVYDSTTGSWKLTGNLLVTGFISAGAKGTSGGSGSTYTQKEWAQIKEMTATAAGSLASAYAVKEAYSEAKTLIDVNTGNITSLTSRIATLEGKATAVSFSQTLTSGTKIGAITVDGTTTNIYAPTPPTKVSQLTNDSGYITGITKAMVEGVLTGNITSHTHSYLPLAGGTMSNTKVVTNLNADLLDGYDITSVVSARYGGDTLDLNEISIPSIYRLRANNPNLPSGFYDSNILTVKIPNNDTAWQLLGVYSSDKLLYRRGTWFADGRGTLRTNAWKEIAFTDSNVASSSQSLLLSNTSDAKAVSGVFFHRDYNVTSLVGNTEGNGVWGHPSDSQDANYGNASILRIGWDSSYYTDIFTGPNLASGKYGLQWRQIINRTAKDWRTILDSSNYNSYCPKLDGTGATGTWGINISGSSNYLGRTLLPASGTSIDTNFFYTVGQLTLGTSEGSAHEGSSNDYNLFSFPSGGTSTSATTANIMNLRLSWDKTKYWHDIFASPNKQFLWHRYVTNGTAYGWCRIVEETTNRVWGINISGNADTLDGYHAQYANSKPWGTIPAISPSGYMDVGKSFEFHYDNTTGLDYSTILACTGNHKNLVNLPSASGTLALTTDNVASSSKWATPRTITLTGSVTGSVSIDGSQNVSLATTTNHTHTFASLNDKPTTISGYGITDALTTKRIAYKRDYQRYVILLCKKGAATTNTQHTINGTFWTAEAGGSRYQAAYINVHCSDWASGHNEYYGFTPFGKGTKSRLVTCTYQSVQYLAITFESLQATYIYFDGSYSNILFTPILYMSKGDTVENSEIYNSITEVTYNKIPLISSAETALTTSNYNSYAPKLDGTGATGTWGISISGDAATLGGLPSSRYLMLNTAYLTDNTNADNLTGVSFYINATGNGSGNSNFPTTYGKLFSWGGTYAYTQLYADVLNNGLYFRTKATAFSGEAWRAIAFTDSNVASATKLATSRTIWGQSFDGTGNVSGALTGVTDITASGNATIAGNVGIGTTTPSYNLHIVGTAYASEGLVSDGYISSAATSTSSDIRLKDNISEISSEMALKWLSMLKPKSWTWNSLAGIKGRSMGFVAQDVEGILPQMIRNRHDNGYLSLDYTQLHAIEVSALQSHEKRIEELERENKILKEELNKLKLNAN